MQGPLVDFRVSRDAGQTWREARANATSDPADPGRDNLFGETAFNNNKVKYGAPHFVDFGQALEHSPDGKAYIVGHGASRPEAIQTWMLGDEVYLARVDPTPEAIADGKQWEFWTGAGWARGDVGAARPLITWENHTGVTTMTYHPALRKYIMVVSTAGNYPSMHDKFDTYFLESDAITGPWKYITYMAGFGPQAYFVHFPSKFLAADVGPDATYGGFLPVEVLRNT